MNSNQFSYKGLTNTDMGLIMGKVLLPVTPAISETTQIIPNRYGSVYQGSSYGSMTITVPIYYRTPGQYLYRSDDGIGAEQKIREISAMLIDPQEPRGTEYPLIFGDLPDVTFYAHITSIADPEQINDGVADWSSTIIFECSDPRGFLAQQDFSVPDTTAVIPVKGNTPVGSIIVATFNQDVKTFTVVKDTGEQSTEFVQLGGDNDLDGDTSGSGTDKTRLLVDDPCTTLSTWTKITKDANPVSTVNIDIDGTMASTDLSLRAAVKNADKGQYDFGTTGHDNWYGPAELHQALTYSPKNWKMSVRLHHTKIKGKHNYRAMGKVEVYILDTKQQTCGRIGMKDIKGGSYPVAYVQLGHNFDNGTEGKDYKTLYYGSAQNFAHSSNPSKVEVTYKKSKKYLDNNNQIDAFSDFFGQFSIVKQYVKQPDGTTAINWGYSIDQWDATKGVYMANGLHLGGNQVAFVDTTCKYDFDLSTIAYFTVKHDITEDKAKVDYHDVFQTITNYHVEELLDAPSSVTTNDSGQNVGGSGTATDKTGVPPQPGDTPEKYTIEATGTFTFNMNVRVRNTPAMSDAGVATYSSGQSVAYDQKVYADKHYWLSYISYSGGRRYVPYFGAENNTIGGTDSNPVNPVKPANDATSGDNTKVPDQSSNNNDMSDFDQQVFHAGDEVHIDCDTGHVFLNNEPADYLISPQSTFFMLDGGVDNTLAFEPSSPDVDITISVRPAIQ
ncbi:SH3 domain-containing protein [Lentilactobacillus kosonis]|uniref:Phage-related protein n=1 Tax=Lentilactobacillus kosonis TaxID=2810561 RepID=A0A401FPT4_9LACO|nr:SH3 domain-containing protein [Lentilactobacillus kosonis]GAY74357.1 phage-related protein [Lentilactobacillus kosonis]